MTRHRTPWVIALIAIALAAPAIGQDRGGRDDRDRDRPSSQGRSNDPPGQRPGPGPAPRMQAPRMQAPPSPPPRMDRGDRRDRNDRNDRGDRGDRADRGRGAGPDHGLYRGSRLPQQYRGRPSVVDDWCGHRLSAPPRGYHWVQVGADYVLVAIATGIILQLILDQ